MLQQLIPHYPTSLPFLEFKEKINTMQLVVLLIHCKKCKLEDVPVMKNITLVFTMFIFTL